MQIFNGVDLEILIRIPLQSILYFTRFGDAIGYIAVEESIQGEDCVTVYTPFTADGLMKKTRCFKCAIKSLIHLHENEGELKPADRRRPSVEIEVHVISLGRQLH